MFCRGETICNFENLTFLLAMPVPVVVPQRKNLFTKTKTCGPWQSNKQNDHYPILTTTNRDRLESNYSSLFWSQIHPSYVICR